MSTKNWSVTENSRQVHTLHLGKLPAGKEARILLMADEHWDNAHTDLALLKKHHEEAKAIGAPILKIGDLFCAMQGKWDRRADQNQLREEHRGNNYLDRLVDTAAKWYRPYADDIALITPGNHETSIAGHHQTDLTDRLCHDLKVAKGGYWGYVKVTAEVGGRLCQFLIHYHHGYGGGGEVTRGLIDNNRTRGQYDGDVFVSGHIHRRNMEENIMTRLSRDKIVRHKQLFLRCSSYKDEHSDAPNSWHSQGGRAARPLGGWWLIVKAVHHNDMRELDYTALAAD
jgi:hypothetical protein